MPYTQGQLTAMSEREIDCAVAARFLPCDYYLDDKLRGYAIFNPCNNPNDYMPIAIDNSIDIIFDRHNNGMFCNPTSPLVDYEDIKYHSYSDVGRAVCEAYLMKGEEK